ncbi:MAG: protein kinase [Phycisphaerales bacterium]
MTPERWRQVEAVFNEALDRPLDEHEPFLITRCGQDLELLAEVKSLLAQAADATEFLEEPAVKVKDALSAAEDAHDRPLESMVGESVGRYRVVRLIASGGMGVVYEAQQEHPRRTVALKLIRPGLASNSVVRRFEQEAQVLAILQHPGIAQVYEAGVAETRFGRQPFFAMEYVAGEALTAHARRHGLSTRAKLELIARVCDALQHAHHKGVIHRDLKPSNILVVEDDASTAGGTRGGTGTSLMRGGQPKILDFGVARATSRDAGVSTLGTHAGQLVGTISYMSPEQLAGDPDAVDTRSDVYSLGVVLYELLTGTLPHDVQGKALAEAARIVAEMPPKAMTGVTRVDHADVSTIVSTAMERDKSRRYQSAADLAADIRRYLGDQPIVARPASALYQFRKFAQRNRALVGAAALLLVTLLGGLIVSSTLYFRASRAETDAKLATTDALAAAKKASDTAADLKKQRDSLEKINSFFLQTTLEAAMPQRKGPSVTVVDAIALSAGSIGEVFKNEPEREAQVRHYIGNILQEAGRYKEAEPHLRRAAALWREHPPTEEPDKKWVHQIDTDDWLVRVLRREGKARESLDLASKNLEFVLANRPVRSPLCAIYLSEVMVDLGRFDEAISILRGELATQIAAGGPDYFLFRTMKSLAQSLGAGERYEEVRELVDQFQSLGTRRDRLNDAMSPMRWKLSEWELYDGAGMFREAAQAAREAAATPVPGDLESRAGLDYARAICAEALLKTSERTDAEESLALARRVLQFRVESKVYTKLYVLLANEMIARALISLEKWDELAAMRDDLMVHAMNAQRDEPYELITGWYYAAMSYAAEGNHSAALNAFGNQLELRRRACVPGSPAHVDGVRWAMKIAHKAGDDAAGYGMGELLAVEDRFGKDHAECGPLAGLVGRTCMELGLKERAAEIFETALPLVRASFGAVHQKTLTVVRDAAACFAACGKADRARSVLSEALEAVEKELGPSHVWAKKLREEFEAVGARGEEETGHQARGTTKESGEAMGSQLGKEPPMQSGKGPE